jgi:hypothetical protein
VSVSPLQLLIHVEDFCDIWYRGFAIRANYVLTDGVTFIYLFIYGAGVEQSPLLLQPIVDLLYQPSMLDYHNFELITIMNK